MHRMQRSLMTRGSVMTQNMKNFIAKNKLSPIIAGGHVDQNGKPINKMTEHAGTVYLFKDGCKMVLQKEDAQSNPGYEPIWDI